MRFCLFFHAQFFLVVLPRNRTFMCSPGQVASSDCRSGAIPAVL
ncbi:hypothetical protein SS05631_c08060 [Sinorhizobium sp. CCBAU 05631]|nr:hypothetical protein SS05631_c08060 [Sinorhizobium sp. CCBAU 05631]